MATRAQKTKVGFFLLFCILLIVGGAMLISGYTHEPRANYWMEFDESVLGLSTGGTVEYLGVPVGKVTDIYVTTGNKPHVTIEIIKSKVTLREGITAQLVLYSLATGVMYISLRGGEEGAEELKPDANIPTTPSLVTSVSQSVQENLESLKEIVQTLRIGLQGMQPGDFTMLIEDGDSLIMRGQEFIESANQTLVDVKGQAQTSLDKFQHVAENVDGLGADLDETVKAAKQTIETLRVSQTETNVNKALENISTLTKRLDDSAKNFDTVSRSALHEAGNVEYNMRETLRTLNETLDAARELTQYLKKNPSSVIWGKGKAKGNK